MAKRGPKKFKKPPGRPPKNKPEENPPSDNSSNKDKKKSRGRRRGGDKSGILKKKMETFMLDMFSLYEDKEGKKAMLDAILSDERFSTAFVKEFFSLTKKYFDMKIAEMKITDGKTTEELMGGRQGPQNVFLILGLHDDPRIKKAAQNVLAGKPVLEAEFSIVGLNDV